MARGQIWQKCPELPRFMALFPSLLDTLTLTLLIVFEINFKSVIGNCFFGPISGVCEGNLHLSYPALGCAPLWDYTYTPEITLTLLNCFQINFQNITLTLTLISGKVTKSVTLVIPRPHTCITIRAEMFTKNNSPNKISGHITHYMTGEHIRKYVFRSCNFFLQD